MKALHCGAKYGQSLEQPSAGRQRQREVLLGQSEALRWNGRAMKRHGKEALRKAMVKLRKAEPRKCLVSQCDGDAQSSAKWQRISLEAYNNVME